MCFRCGNPRDNNETIETERQRNFEGSPETEPEIEVEEAERDALADALWSRKKAHAEWIEGMFKGVK